MMKAFFENIPELYLRIFSGIIGATLIISAIFFSEWTYFIVFLFISTMTQLEFYKLLGLSGDSPLKTFGTINGVFIFVLTFMVEKHAWPPKYYFLIFIGLSIAFLIKLYKKDVKKPFANLAYTFLGIIYVAIPFALLNMSVFVPNANGGVDYHPEIIFGALLILWANDSGAYFTGRTFGRRQLFARISPKKTWEGSLGGAAFALGSGACMAYFFSDTANSLVHWQWLWVSIIIIVKGTYGDLVESLFKRSIAIKDSGHIIPGHGGFLDRFDGLLIAAPFVVAFLRLFQ